MRASVWIGALLGGVAAVSALEMLMRVLPVSSATKSGYYVDPKIMTYAPLLDGRYAFGWDLRHAQRFRTNSHGFVAEHEFRRDEQAVGLIGDSFVEALALDARDRPAAQLETALGSTRPVYAMGAAGTALLDYAERIRWAHQQLGIRDFVVMMESTDIRQALCGSGNVHSECLDPTTLAPTTTVVPSPSLAKRLLRDSALAQYLVGQLKIDLARILKRTFSYEIAHMPDGGKAMLQPRSRDKLPEAAAEHITAAFFERVKPYATGRLVIFVDADRQMLRTGAQASDSERQSFIGRAQAAGATVIDAAPLFAEHYRRSPLSLDIGPQDAHFNPLSVRLAMSEIASALRSPAPPPEQPVCAGSSARCN